MCIFALSENVGTNGTFVWVDGSDNTYYYWAPDEPNNMDDAEDCGEVSLEEHDKGQWNDIACHHTFGYVCKYDTGKILFSQISWLLKSIKKPQ